MDTTDPGPAALLEARKRAAYSPGAGRRGGRRLTSAALASVYRVGITQKIGGARRTSTGRKGIA
jgi:hypothetical protein